MDQNEDLVATLYSKYAPFITEDTAEYLDVLAKHSATKFPLFAVILSGTSQSSLQQVIVDGEARSEQVVDISLRHCSNVTWESACIINADANQILVPDKPFDKEFCKAAIGASSARVLLMMSGLRVLQWAGLLANGDTQIWRTFGVHKIELGGRKFIAIPCYEPGFSRYLSNRFSKQMPYSSSYMALRVCEVLEGLMRQLG